MRAPPARARHCKSRGVRQSVQDPWYQDFSWAKATSTHASNSLSYLHMHLSRAILLCPLEAFSQYGSKMEVSQISWVNSLPGKDEFFLQHIGLPLRLTGISFKKVLIEYGMTFFHVLWFSMSFLFSRGRKAPSDTPYLLVFASMYVHVT